MYGCLSRNRLISIMMDGEILCQGSSSHQATRKKLPCSRRDLGEMIWPSWMNLKIFRMILWAARNFWFFTCFQRVSFFFPNHSLKPVHHTCRLCFLDSGIISTCLVIIISFKKVGCGGVFHWMRALQSITGIFLVCPSCLDESCIWKRIFDQCSDRMQTAWTTDSFREAEIWSFWVVFRLITCRWNWTSIRAMHRQ